MAIVAKAVREGDRSAFGLFLPRPAGSVISWLDRFGLDPRHWRILFLVYCAAQLGVRVALGQRMNIDEAEAWLWAQELAWGYGPQPPLYIWLQGAVFYLTGPTIFGLALFKEMLLFGILIAAQGLAARWTGVARVPAWFAGAAALMLMWLPEYAWESQRIRTHNVLAALIALLAMWQALRLRDRPSHANHALLGFWIGLGLLAKWNFAFLVVAMIAVMTVERYHERLRWRLVAWLIGLPLVMILPTLLWIVGHPSVALASYPALGIVADRPWHGAFVDWILAATRAAFSFAGLLFLVFGGFLLFGRVPRAERPVFSDSALDEMRFVRRVVGLALVMLLLGGALQGATALQARWLLPVSISVMPVMALLLVARLRDEVRKILVRVTLAVPIVMLIGMVVMLAQELPYKFADASSAAAFLPPNDDRSPYLARVRTAAHLKALVPDRVLKDEALLMAGDCPESVTVLETGITNRPRFAAWAGECGLVPAGPPGVSPQISPDDQVQRFVRR